MNGTNNLTAPAKTSVANGAKSNNNNNSPRQQQVNLLQVESFDKFPVNQVQQFTIKLANHLKPTDLNVTISSQILGLIDAKLDWPDISKCQVSFRAPIVGLYAINVELLNQARDYVTQFQAKAYDLSKVFITGSSGKGQVNQIYEFSVDASEAGEGQLEIAVNEGEIPNQVQVLDNGKCIVNFTPEDAVQHTVDIKFNGHNVNGCPFAVDVSRQGETTATVMTPSTSEIAVTKESHVPKILGEPKLIKEERVLVNSSTFFQIENVNLDGLIVEDAFVVLDPENQPVKYRLSSIENFCYRFDYMPTSVGDHTVELGSQSQLLNKLPQNILEQFPCQIKVYDHSKVLVSDVTDGVVGHPIYFFIDASKAGSGNLEIRVSSKTRNVPNYPQSEANAKIRVYFTPTEAVDHSIDVKFNGSSVPSNPFLVKVSQYPQARLPVTSQDLLKYLAIDETVSFNIDYIGTRESNNVPPEKLTDKSCQVHVLRPDFVYTKLSTVQLKPSDKNDKQMRFQINFKPTRIGPYKLFITVNNELLPASPIICNAYNIDEVKVFFNNVDGESNSSLKPVGQVNKPVTFIVDASRAGEGTLALAVVSGLSRSPVPTEVKVSDKGHGIYNLTFVPTELAPHSIDMSFNDRLVPGSPFIVDMLDEQGKPALAAQVDANEAISTPVKQTNSDLVASQQQMVQNFESLSLKQQQNGSTLKKNTPKSASKQASKRGVAYGLVDASNIVYLSPGVLDSSKNQINLIGPNREKLPFQLGKGSPQAGEPKKPYIEYTPKSIGTHTIQVLDGGKDPLQYFVEICDPSMIKITDLKPTNNFSVGKQVTFCLDSSEAGKIQLDQLTIMGPKRATGKIRDGDQTILSRIKSISSSSSSQTIPIEYSVSQIGEHLQEIKFVPQIPGKYSIDVRCLGQVVGPVPFEIEVRSDVNHRSDLPVSAQAEASNSLKSGSVADMREEELLQSIVVHGISLKHSPVNSTGAFIIETNRMAHARDFDVLITDPSNNLVDVQCYLQQDGNLLAEWIPRRVGAHKIEVLYKDNHVPGSPFETESFDPSSVLIESIASTTVSVGEKVEFRLNRKEAGYGELDVAITSPLGQDLPIEVRSLDDADLLGEIISFNPTVAGKYKMSITFGGYEVPKSPITFIARDGRDPIKVHGAGLKYAEVNRSAQFIVESPTGGELKLRIECGDREIVPKIEHNDNSYTIKYKPTEVGYSTISLYWNGAHVDGSPFAVPINDLSKILFLSGTNKSSNSNNQRIIDYEPGVPKEITLDTSKCGPGDLKAEAYCRANTNIKFSIPKEQYVLNRYRLTFCCPPKQEQLAKGVNLKDISTEATYLIRFYYNNLFVPETLASVVVSPLQTYQARNRSLSRSRKSETNQSGAISESNNNNTNSDYLGSLRPKKSSEVFNVDSSEPIVALRGHGLADAKCGEEAEFTIDGSEAGFGRPEIRFTGPSSDEIKINLIEVGDNRYKVEYLVNIPGIYSLNVLWDGKQIAGCPVSVNVVGSCDPTKVVCTGDGLKGGILGEEIKVFIDTRRAGPGELTALCVGPQKVAFCELLDRGDGSFILYIKPQEPGKQLLTIKYGGQNIPKSPFLIKISGKPDPSKVRVYGPGVEHGVLSLYQSRFVCDTRGAGAGQLTVRIRGPKGAFRMETQRENQKDRTILCKYDPTEPGDYRIEIKWSGRHVPGSPFSVMIFDTQEELNRFLVSGHSQTNPGHQLVGNKLSGPNQMLHHQVPYQPTMVEYGHYSTMTSPNHQQPPFRLQ